MARFYGNIGYALPPEESPIGSGVWVPKAMVAIAYRGDVIRTSRRLSVDEKVNSDITTGNAISVVADAFANQNFAYIKYVEWMGVRWIATTVAVLPPRLELTLGGVYYGPEA